MKRWNGFNGIFMFHNTFKTQLALHATNKKSYKTQHRHISNYIYLENEWGLQ